MIYEITTSWNEDLWEQAEHVYEEAFPAHGRKNRALIRSMFERGICMLHTWREDAHVIAMALTAWNQAAHVLIVDYIAVGRAQRGQGVGVACMGDIRKWADTAGCHGIVIEVEAEPSKENAERIRFWEKAGFRLTDYVHTYIWVPETYRAMYLSLGELEQQDDGKQLFSYITEYHEQAYRMKN
ncbi:GNAT family N-acetyltransferase [Paenibacillus qinlingensis]|uniref:GNAT superfamily N-acetyltransferase n=1 Tax=Paenibacillus qinlingensis TaxID=1837343 RepID=A0ABU1NR24_9BACL|nr:GNAT family N-acetyltransferase [Paenibacillus qinlingensis]MDR6549931.1 GNAT superfamily N-acetyltransferase [Paenibacillus qinlingensis]